jgi:RNA polymerase sigma factor (sigma-70 family)
MAAREGSLMVDFDSLYTQYENYVHMRIRNLLHYRPDLIDDAMQEIWIKVWRALPNLKSDGNLKAWLWLITTNTVRDTMRHAKMWEPHYPSLEATMDHFDIEPDEYRNYITPDPHEYIPPQLDRQAIRMLVWSALSAKDRQTLMDYVANEKITKQSLYAARRNYKDRYERTKKKMEASA